MYHIGSGVVVHAFGNLGQWIAYKIMYEKSFKDFRSLLHDRLIVLGDVEIQISII